MTKFAITVFALVTLVQPALSVADVAEKPSSLAPHPHTKHHVYGAPIGPAIVGHKKTAHHGHLPKKPSSRNADRHTR